VNLYLHDPRISYVGGRLPVDSFAEDFGRNMQGEHGGFSHLLQLDRLMSEGMSRADVLDLTSQMDYGTWAGIFDRRVGQADSPFQVTGWLNTWGEAK